MIARNLNLRSLTTFLFRARTEDTSSSRLICVARMPVPKMVENGFYSSFVFSRLIWACFVGESWPCSKMANHGFQQIRVEVDFSINC
jgi:hypothetical protein